MDTILIIIAVILVVSLFVVGVFTAIAWIPISVFALVTVLVVSYVRTSPALRPEEISEKVNCTFDNGRIKISLIPSFQNKLWNPTWTRLVG